MVQCTVQCTHPQNYQKHLSWLPTTLPPRRNRIRCSCMWDLASLGPLDAAFAPAPSPHWSYSPPPPPPPVQKYPFLASTPGRPTRQGRPSMCASSWAVSAVGVSCADLGPSLAWHIQGLPARAHSGHTLICVRPQVRLQACYHPAQGLRPQGLLLGDGCTAPHLSPACVHRLPPRLHGPPSWPRKMQDT